MIKIVSVIVLTLLVAACGGVEEVATGPAKTSMEKVTGTVTYRERIALKPGAVVEVQLLDVSLADAAATQIATQTITTTQQVPIAFELSYDLADVDERMTYVVSATIREDGRLLFATDRHYPVLTRGFPNQVDLVLVRIRGDG